MLKKVEKGISEMKYRYIVILYRVLKPMFDSEFLARLHVRLELRWRGQTGFLSSLHQFQSAGQSAILDDSEVRPRERVQDRK